MGRIALAAVVLAGLAFSAGTAAAARWTARGAITHLNARAITVNGKSCQITSASPGRSTLRLFFVGARVKIVCANGVLLDIDVLHALPTINLQPGTSSASSSTSSSSTSVVTSQTQTSSTSSSSTLSGVGSGTFPVTALGGGSITAGSGSVTLSCTLGPTSPNLDGLQIGDRITYMHCENGVLTALTRA